MKKFILVLVILCVVVINSTHAQVVTANQYQNKADEAFELKDYNTALSHYLTILNDEPNRSDLYWKTAESARMTRHFVLAEKYYEAFSKTPNVISGQPLLNYRLAIIKKSLKKYDEAIALFQKYAATGGEMASSAMFEIEATKWAKEVTQTEPYKVEHLDEKVNTNYVEAGPIQVGSNLYFTSAYFKTPDAIPVTNVFSFDFKNKSQPIAINSQVPDIHTAHYAPNTEGSRLYYNLCEKTDSGTFHCEIYVRAKDPDGTWGKPVILDTTLINIAGATATQPNIGFDKAKGKDVLYFVSNRPGGKGGLDIWAADIEANGTINPPVNLSAINTTKDDITPFYLNGPQILLFSTEGGKTIGGFDIFKSERLATGFAEAVNIGYPMNSSYDDMYPSFSAENAKYFFVSNRPGGMCESAEKDCICNDIYAHIIKVSLDVSTFLAEGGKELNGCRLDLLDLETGKTIYDINSGGNSFKFELEPNRKYQLIATKKGYQPDTANINSFGLYMPVNAISQKMFLKPNLKLQIYVFDKIGRKALSGATVEIRSEDGKNLLATETLKGNFMTWGGIEFGQKYLILAKKETYDKDENTLTIETWSSTISKFTYSDSLYLKPFSGLPVTLYYDNDFPDPRSRKMVTIYTYPETYSAYYAKLPEYLTAYYKVNQDVSSNGANEISDFFQNNIKLGYDKLNDFSKKLVNYLGSGYGMEIVLEGYASPLAETDYNRILTSRRVSAVINHFYKYSGGVFRSYIKNGQLRLKVEPYGEEKAQKDVSDDAKDPRKSIYSVAAMKERKVEIKEINEFPYNQNDGYNISEALGIYFDTDEFGKRPKKNTTLGDVDNANNKGKKSKRTAKGKNAGDELDSRYANQLKTSRSSGKKQRREIVFVDSYSGEIINNSASIELFDQYSEKMLAKGKRKGKSYFYNIDLTKNYLVKGSVAGYSEATLNQYANPYTDGGNSVLTDTMYLTPFSGLPLSIYFDNGRPPGSSENTSASYSTTYRPFIARKREFIKAYNKMMTENGGMIIPENSMSSFFELEVKGGYERLNGFSSIMKSYLQRGYQLEVVIEGYASPLDNAEYNQKLSSRRINAVINHFSNFSGGSLKKYVSSGQLKISVQSHGEVNTSVSDKVDNISSIYSLEASRERKVIIKDIIILNNSFYKN